MEQIVRHSSTNGRWGVVVVAAAKIDPRLPQFGSLERLGTFEGKDTFQFSPLAEADEGAGTWWYLLDAGDCEAVAGAEIVYSIGLQSSESASIVALGPFGVIRQYGYKRRSSWISAFRDGRPIDLPAPVLAAMGLLPTP